MYEKTYTVRYSEVTDKAVSSLSALVSYFQDTTMFHSDTVGQGIHDLMEHHMAWLLASWRIEVYRYPRYAETVTARTWATQVCGRVRLPGLFSDGRAGEYHCGGKLDLDSV